MRRWLRAWQSPEAGSKALPEFFRRNSQSEDYAAVMFAAPSGAPRKTD
jgi:hypothetical protein